MASLRHLYLVNHTIERFSSAKLPLNREVLQRFYHLKNFYNFNQSQCLKTVINEIKLIWLRANLNTKSEFTIKDYVNKLVKDYKLISKSKNHKSESVRCKNFKIKLDELFDIASTCPSKIKEDLDFLEAQRKPGRIGCMASKDKAFEKSEMNKLKRKQNERLRIEKEKSRSASPNFVSICDLVLSDEEEDGQMSEGELINSVFKLLKDDESQEEYLKDPTFKMRLQTEVNNKIKVLNSNLLTTLDRCKISYSSAFRIIADVLNSLKYDLNQVTFSIGSLHRERIKNRDELSKQIKDNFQFPSRLILHFDGKKIFDKRLRTFVEYCVIKVSFGKEDKILNILSLEDAKALQITSAITKEITSWDLEHKIVGFSFDTTATNTGKVMFKL